MPVRPARPKPPARRGDGEVRIVGGSLKRSKLKVPDLPGLRPTPDRVRETLFNWIGPGIRGTRVLDLCAGTGALAFEALSRGARHACINEPQPQLQQQLQADARRLGVFERCQFSAQDGGQWLRSYQGPPFDLAFVDPPYAGASWGELLSALSAHLQPGALVYLEHPLTVAAPFDQNWRIHRQARAGQVSYYLLEHARSAAQEEL